MHQIDIDLTLDRISKIEGSASLELRVRDGKVEHVHFKTTEFKRFFTKAMIGKPIIAIPQHLSRICGTCSNAHILCSIESCEKALGIIPTEQTMLLRILTVYGLIIRDHALHLYLFALPDIFNKDAFLDFDENNPEEHRLLHDGFEVKSAGNFLATLIAGRSVHGMYPTIGGFAHFPDQKGINEAIEKLENIRPAVKRIIKIFKNSPFHFDRKTNFMALLPKNNKYGFGFLEGTIVSNKGEAIEEKNYRDHLERVVLPYSQASAYRHENESYMVGALARINLAKNMLHRETIKSIKDVYDIFPSTDIYHNNLAQAIEILHAVDDSIDILTHTKFTPEPIIKQPYKASVGIGVIEAPRGTLYHKVEIDGNGVVMGGEVVVPTGQNQINIEEDIHTLVNSILPKASKDEIAHEIEKLIRAYDPCMSCASHFLKVKWDER